MEVVDKKLVVTSGACQDAISISRSGTDEGQKVPPSEVDMTLLTTSAATASGRRNKLKWMPLVAGLLSCWSSFSPTSSLQGTTFLLMGALAVAPTVTHAQLTCDDVIEVEIHGPVIEVPEKSRGAIYI